MHSIRERFLTALSCDQPDRVPCTFMLFDALRKQCGDEQEFAARQCDMGLDPFVHLGPLAMSFDPRVTTSTEKKPAPGGEGFVLEKTYRTPDGDLTTVVRQTDDWPYGDDVPLFDDYLIPRSTKPLVTGPGDLPALRHLFGPFRDADIAAYRKQAGERKQFAEKRGLPTVGGWGRGDDPGVMGMDCAMWLTGMQEMMLMAADDPDTVEELADIISEWNGRQIELILDPLPDMVMRRAWYETTEFWTPAQHARFIQPRLRKEVDLVHQAGAKFGYIITSAMMPILPNILAAGPDVIIGLDPVEGKGTGFADIKKATRGKAALWGGVNGFLNVEMGTADELRKAVKDAMDVLKPGGGFLICPVDNVREDTPKSRENVAVFIEACREYGGY